jgi:RHS repeat-associated protein
MFLAVLSQSGATATATASSPAGSCSSCSGSDRTEIGFRASADLRVVTDEEEPTKYGSVSISLAGRTMSATATSEGEVTTGTGMVDAPQETVLDGSMTVYLPIMASGCVSKFSADFMPAEGCGQTVEIRLKEPDATSYGSWSNNLHPSWSMFYTTAETVVVQFQLRLLRSESGPATAPTAATDITPPTVDWVPSGNSGQVQEVPTAFSSRIPMGSTTGTGKFNAGSLVLAGSLGTASLASRSNVMLRSPIDTDPFEAAHPELLHAVNDAGNALRQVRSDTRLMDVTDVVEGATVIGFSVRVFEAGDYGSFSNGLYSINEAAVPSVTYTYRKVFDGETYLGISVEKSHRDGTSETQTYLNTSSPEFTISSGDGQETVTVATTIVHDDTDGWSGTELETVTRDGVLYSKTLRDLIFQTVTDSDGIGTTVIPFMTSEFRYLTVEGAGTGLMTTRTPSNMPGLPEVIRHPDGSWEKRVYYDGTGEDGGQSEWLRLTKQIITPWNDAPANPPESGTSGCQVESLTYAAVDGVLQAVAGTTEIPGSARVRLTDSLSSTITNLTGLLSAAGLSAAWVPAEIDLVGLRVAEEVGTEQIPSTSIRYRSRPEFNLTTPPLVPWAGRTFATLDAEGDGSVTGYEPGTYNATTGAFTVVGPAAFASATHLRTITLELRNFGLPVDDEKVMRTAIEDRVGRIVREELHPYNGTDWSLATTETIVYNDAPTDALATVTRYKDGRLTGTQIRVSPFLTIETDEQGIVTQTYSDALGRVISVVVEGCGDQPARTTGTVWLGRTSTTTLSAGALSLASEEQRDLLGRIVSTTDATGAVTGYTYPEGGRNTLVTHPGNNTLVTTRSIDGLTLSITGTAAVNEFRNYAVSNGQILATRRSGASNSGRLVSTATDGFGRQVSVTSPSPADDGAFVTITTAYAPGTRRAISRSTSAASTYPQLSVRPDPASSLRLTGINKTGNTTLTIASQDRITATRHYFAKDSGTGGLWWRVSESKTYDDNTDSQSAIVSTVRERLSGNADGAAAKTVETLPGGGTVTTTVTLDAATKARTTTTTRTDCTLPQTTVNINGLDFSQTTHQSDVPTTRVFDALGRIFTETNPYGAVTKTIWNQVGQVESVTDNFNHTTSYTYHASNTPSAGRLDTITYPGVTTVTPSGQKITTKSWSKFTWSTRGELLTTSGTAAYPVSYTYDQHGVLETQTTKRGTGTTTVAETTTWQLAPNSGVLLKRINADTSEITYTWYANGKAHTRQRESGAKTEWVWNPLGDLTTINYSNDNNLTPDVSITDHNRLGQPATITQSGIGTETITFRPGLGVPLTHSYGSGHTLLPGRSITWNAPDTYGQPTGFTPSDGPVVAHAWQQGLLHTVSTSQGTHTYQYRPHTALVQSVTATNTFIQSYSRDTANRLLSASSAVPGTTPTQLTRHGYRLDELNRRSRTTQLDGSTWTWDFNDRSEVTSAVRKQPSGTEVAALGATYTYDEIGNRITSTSPILGDFGYIANDVNQYTTITSNNSRTVIGNGPTSPTITVNAESTLRIDTLFYKSLSANNANSPKWLQATISNGGQPQIRNFWLSKASTSLTYLGGNLTNDGEWSYLWDAEDRLVRMETSTAAVNAGRPYRKLEFAYDWTGRRLSRTVTNSSNIVLSATRWLYNGWNPVAEYAVNGTTGALTLAKSYLWGLDISGTLSEAGGVGGLLAVITSTPTTVYYPSFDGNGNITAWTQSGATAPVCRREYDAFGNIVVELGTAPCAFGFSTKLEDPETRLLYYGYRYYSPTLGRWLSKDPIEEEGGLNLYGFVGNDGVDGLDYLGLLKLYITWWITYDLAPNTQIAAFTNGPIIPIPGNSNGITVFEYRVSPICKCISKAPSDPFYVFEEFDVGVNIHIYLRNEYSSDEEREFSMTCELQHAQLYDDWVNGKTRYKTPQKAILALESEIKKQNKRFQTNDACVAAARKQFDGDAGIKGAGTIALNRNVKLDEHGNHSWEKKQKELAKEKAKQKSKS